MAGNTTLRVTAVLFFFLLPFSVSGAEPDKPDGTANAPVPSTKTAGSAESDERVRAIVLQNKAARQGIDSYSMKVRWERRTFPKTPLDAPMPEGRVVSYGEGVWMEKGAKWHVHHTKRWESHEPGGPSGPPDPFEGKEYASWTVYNGEYLATHDSRHQGNIRLYPQALIDAKVVLLDGELFPNPLEWGFGFGTGFLDEEYEKCLTFNNVHWESEDVEAPDGPKVKLIRRVHNEHGVDSRSEFTLDPARGFLIVRSQSSAPPDTQLDLRSFELQQWPDGHWYPARATVRDLDAFTSYTFSEVKFNAPIDDKKFTIDAFDLDYAMTRTDRYELDNSKIRMLFREGQWIPESLVPAHLRPVLPGDGRKFGDLGPKRK